MDDSLGSLYLGGTDVGETRDHVNRVFLEGSDVNSEEENDNSIQDTQLENEKESRKSTKRRRPSASPPPRRARKCPKTPGGSSAVPKPVQADYDSDDARIIELKQQGHTDKYVAQRLRDEGRVRYVPKTVSTRWLRLRKVLEQVEDDKLDDEMSDWHVDEDDYLLESFAAAEEKFAPDLERLQARKWREVAIELAARLKKKKFSGKACKERFEGLQSGTAILPVEHDPDQEGRRAMRELRVAEAKSRRAAEAEEANRVKLQEEMSRSEKKNAKAEKAQQRKIEKEQRSAQKMEEKRMRKEREIGRKRMAANRTAVRQAEQQKQAEKKYEKESIEALYHSVVGRPMHPRQDCKGNSDLNHREVYDGTSSPLTKHVEGDSEELTSIDLNEGNSDVEIPELDEKGHSSSSTDAVAGRNGARPYWTNDQAAVPVTKMSLLNPRSVLTDAELQVLLCERNLPRRNLRETHAQVVARLAAADEQLTMEQLDVMIGITNLSSLTTREQKIRRLQHIDAMMSFAGSGGIVATSKEFKKGYEGYRGEFKYLLAET